MIYRFNSYTPSLVLKDHLNMGGRNPDGEEIVVTSQYFTRGGKPWIGVMGEYHFVRDSRDNWYSELCKMKAGGVGIVATYLFWIYHEELEGSFDFSGDRDLREFVLDAERAGLDVVIRIGPWAHGECRNGGFPDWLLQKPYKLRDNNDGYMEKVRIWYGRIYDQVKGLFYKDGGNIIGVQLENELVNNAEHLLALKNTALEIGFDAPLYTVTGWNNVYGAKIPVDDVVPVFGAYPTSPWSNGTGPLPLSPHYVFCGMRNDTAIGSDLADQFSPDGWRLPYERYPFATCELGGGIEVTHHRRPRIRPMDIYAMSLVKLGSGNNLIGYYMYHGGTNKLGTLSTLNESKATGYPNDYAILSYDFQAPISEYGETREHYGLLNMLHMFASDFGNILAPMEYVSGTDRVSADDKSSLRYCMRTDGSSGFVFINHYQRLSELDDIENAVIDTGSIVFPPISIKGEISFFMPYNIELSGNLLEYATAQLLCCAKDTFFFAAIPGIEPTFKFRNSDSFTASAGLDSAVSVNDIRIVTLTWEQAKYARKLSGAVYVGDSCDLYELSGDLCAVEVGSFTYHKWDGEQFKTHSVRKEYSPADVVFERSDEPFTPPYAEELNIGGKRRRTWYTISVTSPDGFIEIPFECDAAQIYCDGELIADNYYYGVPWRVPARMIYGKDYYLVTSEIQNDFYREV